MTTLCPSLSSVLRSPIPIALARPGRDYTDARHAGEDGEAPVKATQKPTQAPKTDARPAQNNNRRGVSGNEAGMCISCFLQRGLV